MFCNLRNFRNPILQALQCFIWILQRSQNMLVPSSTMTRSDFAVINIVLFRWHNALIKPWPNHQEHSTLLSNELWSGLFFPTGTQNRGEWYAWPRDWLGRHRLKRHVPYTWRDLCVACLRIEEFICFETMQRMAPDPYDLWSTPSRFMVRGRVGFLGAELTAKKGAESTK